MNEYLDPQYSIDDLWQELGHKRPIVAEARRILHTFVDVDGDIEVETQSGQMISVSQCLHMAREDMPNANDMSAIEWAIWWRTQARDPHTDPELFNIIFGHHP